MAGAGRPRKVGRRIVLAAGLGALATVAGAALCWRPIAARVVTVLAYRDAEGFAEAACRIADDARAQNRTLGDAVKALASRYGFFFRRGLLDRDEVARRFPAAGFTPEALPVMIVIVAYCQANEAWFGRRRAELGSEEAAVAEEAGLWLEPALTRPATAETIANVLAEEWTFVPESERRGTHREKAQLAALLCCPPDDRSAGSPAKRIAEYIDRLRARVIAAQWEAILANCDDPREKVRAGSLVLLSHHPSAAAFAARARKALEDPAPLPPLAAACLLALRRDPAGEAVLIGGLDHPRWEIRTWCTIGLAELRTPAAVEAIRKMADAEPDPWVKHELMSRLPAFPAGGPSPAGPPPAGDGPPHGGG